MSGNGIGVRYSRATFRERIPSQRRAWYGGVLGLPIGHFIVIGSDAAHDICKSFAYNVSAGEIPGGDASGHEHKHRILPWCRVEGIAFKGVSTRHLLKHALAGV